MLLLEFEHLRGLVGKEEVFQVLIVLEELHTHWADFVTQFDQELFVDRIDLIGGLLPVKRNQYVLDAVVLVAQHVDESSFLSLDFEFHSLQTKRPILELAHILQFLDVLVLVKEHQIHFGNHLSALVDRLKTTLNLSLIHPEMSDLGEELLSFEHCLIHGNLFPHLIFGIFSPQHDELVLVLDVHINGLLQHLPPQMHWVQMVLVEYFVLHAFEGVDLVLVGISTEGQDQRVLVVAGRGDSTSRDNLELFGQSQNCEDWKILLVLFYVAQKREVILWQCKLLAVRTHTRELAVQRIDPELLGVFVEVEDLDEEIVSEENRVQNPKTEIEVTLLEDSFAAQFLQALHLGPVVSVVDLKGVFELFDQCKLLVKLKMNWYFPFVQQPQLSAATDVHVRNRGDFLFLQNDSLVVPQNQPELLEVRQFADHQFQKLIPDQKAV